ncbi:hypothetical protein BU15DRAFT_78093 [Melanogaster broomeanus]|nr:hypothetical protein BU15DRAFT_78093 [Melanogaster broomeanus]
MNSSSPQNRSPSQNATYTNSSDLVFWQTGHPTQLSDDHTANVHEGFNTIWGPDHANSLVYNAHHPASRMMHLAQAPIATHGSAPAGFATAESEYECAWRVKGSRCREQCHTLQDLLVHLAEAHGARGAANKKLVCEWTPSEVILAIRHFGEITSNATLKPICISQTFVIPVAKATPAQIH